MNHRPLVPKDPSGVLWVLVIGRVSTPQQDVGNIEAGYEYAQKILKADWQGPLHVKHLGEQGSGMRTDRATILEAVREIETGRWDVVLMEDSSKPYRNPRWIYAFVQDAVDMGCRVLAPGDNLDTADDNWEVTLGAAALRHGLHIPDTRRRVRRTAVHSFHRGGMVTKIRFGYRKLSKEEADSGQFGPKGLRLAKLPEWTPTIQEMRQRVLRDESYAAIADWLIDERVPTGLYVKGGRWTDKLVIALLRDPILSGSRTFRDTIYEPIFKTGKHRRRKNDQPEQETYPELAHLSPEEQEELIDCMDQRKGTKGARRGRDHPLYQRPRSRSMWPGQHARCAICGGLMYRYGQFLRCAHSLPAGGRSCWHHVQVEIAQVYAKILPWILDVLDQLPRFREVMVYAAWQEWQRRQHRNDYSLETVDRRVADLEQQKRNLAKAIGLGGKMDVLVDELKGVQQALKGVLQEKQQLITDTEDTGKFRSQEDVAAALDQALMHLAETSLDFADVLRRLLPVFTIQPVQALDCPQVRPRAQLTLSLTAWSAGTEAPSPVSVTLDLFDPPVHIKHLAACVQAKEANPKASLRTLAGMLGLNYMTVKRALNYARRMTEAGLANPYRELHERPQNASRWKKRAGGDDSNKSA